MISRRQWVSFFGPAVPIKVVATVKIRNIKLIHYHFVRTLPFMIHPSDIKSRKIFTGRCVEYVKNFAWLM
jgi:hypothetical protein